jgi:hypothetical protein
VTATKRYLNDSGWASIDTAPIDEEVFLLVTDGIGAPYCLAHPWKLTSEGWLSCSGKCAALKVTPLRWCWSYFPRRRKRTSVFELRRPALTEALGRSEPMSRR